MMNGTRDTLQLTLAAAANEEAATWGFGNNTETLLSMRRFKRKQHGFSPRRVRVSSILVLPGRA